MLITMLDVWVSPGLTGRITVGRGAEPRARRSIGLEREGADTALLDEGQRFQGCALLARCWQKAALGGACAGGGRLSLESIEEAMYLFMDVSTRRTMLTRAYKPMRDTRRFGRAPYLSSVYTVIT